MGKIVIPATPVARFQNESFRAIIEKLVVDIDPVQSGSGDPSSSNVRPITGHTGVNVEKSGKNLLAKPFDHRDNVANTLANCFFAKAGTYNFHFASIAATSWRIGIMMKDASGNNLSDVAYKPQAWMSWNTTSNLWLQGANGTNTSLDITIAVDCYIRFIFVLGDTTTSTTATEVQFEAGSTATAFEEYKGTAVAATFPTEAATVYGGNLDIISGKLTVTDANIASYNGETLPSTWISSMDVYEAGTTPTTGAQVVYKLATPLTYQLTAQQVSLLIGTNIIFADTGDVSVEYFDGSIALIKLNGKDFTSYFTQRGMKVSYEKVLGENGGTFLTGEREEDVLAWKAIVSLTCMPLTDEQQAEILSEITVSNPTLFYFDPRSKAYRTIRYMATLAEVEQKGKGGTGIEYWTGLVLKAEEK